MKAVNFHIWMEYLEDPANQELQCTQVLERSRDGRKCNCCLGVAANVCGVPKGETGKSLTRFTFGDTSTNFTPPDEWEGLPGDYISVLVNMNDTYRFSFAQIAEAIRASVQIEGDDVGFDVEALRKEVNRIRDLRMEQRRLRK